MKTSVVLAVLGLSVCWTAAAADGNQPILSADGCWRVFAVRGPGAVPLELLKTTRTDATEPALFCEAIVGAAPEKCAMEGPPPPKEWKDPDFDDSSWLRAAGPFSGGGRGHQGRWQLLSRKLLCLRGNFSVTDPATAGRLTLTLKYAGGVVVYLNGREVLRQDLPGGEITADTQALPYPREAYVDAAGAIIPYPAVVEQRVRAGEKELAERVARREAREARAVALPVSALRKGVNVLALELHCAAYRPEALLPAYEDAASGSSVSPRHWPHIGLNELQLSTDAAAENVRPNLSRPPGFQLWNEDVNREFDAAAYGDSGSRQVNPIRLLGARNGFFSGVIVAGSDQPIEKLVATMSDLQGPGTIPAASVRVRYAQLSGLGRPLGPPPGYQPGTAFAGLDDEPPERIAPSAGKGAVQPVWVTVRVPPQAAPGKYRGVLTVAAAGVPPTAVPVELEVVAWTVPEAGAFRRFMGAYESPDTLALHYNVPLYSEEHWKLVEKSVALLGYFGNNLMNVPLICRTEAGNDESMVAWIKRPDGGYEYDLSAFDRYLELMTRHCNIKIVSCRVIHGGGWQCMDPTKRAVAVTVVDPATKRRENVELPLYGTEESKKQWKPLLDQLRERLRKKGLDGTMILGIQHYSGLHKVANEFFSEVAPGVSWHTALHGRPDPRYFASANHPRYTEWVYVPLPLPVPGLTPRYANDGTGPFSISMLRLYDCAQPPISMRTLAERIYILGDSGVGRFGLDYWPEDVSAKGGAKRPLHDRWADNSATLYPHFLFLSVPGKHGALGTAKIEALREGLQETEARFFIEDALAAGKLDAPLAARCRRLLDARAVLCKFTQPTADELAVIPLWAARAEEAYRTAAEVAAWQANK